MRKYIGYAILGTLMGLCVSNYRVFPGDLTRKTTETVVREYAEEHPKLLFCGLLVAGTVVGRVFLPLES